MLICLSRNLLPVIQDLHAQFASPPMEATPPAITAPCPRPHILRNHRLAPLAGTPAPRPTRPHPTASLSPRHLAALKHISSLLWKQPPPLPFSGEILPLTARFPEVYRVRLQSRLDTLTAHWCSIGSTCQALDIQL